VADPGSGAYLTPGSVGKKTGSGSGIRDEQTVSYFLELRKPFLLVKILKFFDADPGSGMETIRIRDPGMEKSRIRDKHPGSATLLTNLEFKVKKQKNSKYPHVLPFSANFM
jgi:hypothetical protein